MTELGLSLSARAMLPIGEYGRLARRAERAGFTAVFATETASDALAPAQAMVQETSTIAVGTAVTNIYWRHPALMGVSAAALAQLSGGRFLLGLGTANAGLNHDQLGLPATPPLRTMREYVEVVRAVLSGRPVSYHGEVFHLDGFTPALAPGPRVAIHIAAMLPKMLELAGAVADGVVLNLAGPATVARSVARVRAAAAANGRDPAQMRVLVVVPCAVSDDPAASAEAARALVAGYASHPAASRLFAAAPLGGTDLAQVARVAASSGVPAAAELVSDELATDIVITDDVGGRLQAFRDAGADLPILFPVPVRGDWRASIETALAALP